MRSRCLSIEAAIFALEEGNPTRATFLRKRIIGLQIPDPKPAAYERC